MITAPTPTGETNSRMLTAAERASIDCRLAAYAAAQNGVPEQLVLDEVRLAYRLARTR